MPTGIYMRTEEHKRHISEAKRGKRTSTVTEFKKGHKLNCGSDHPMFGKHHSLATIAKERATHIGVPKPSTTQAKHWNWQGGITSLRNQLYNHIKTQQWRVAVFSRDGWECQVCGRNGYLFRGTPQ